MRLIDILEQRTSERLDLKTRYGVLTSANLSHGDYSGPILAATEHYFVQECEASETPILHDRVTLVDVAPSANRIVYQQGVGTVD